MARTLSSARRTVNLRLVLAKLRIDWPELTVRRMLAVWGGFAGIW